MRSAAMVSFSRIRTAVGPSPSQGKARLDFGESSDTVDRSHEVEDDWALIVPAGVWHNVVSIGENDLELYSIYFPPEHPDGTVHRTKAEADADEEHH